ncbi:MAG: thermonuclease family protein [Desulfovibrio sp.]|nr:thermonuclease family protein [Desulfovibrio sp.]
MDNLLSENCPANLLHRHPGIFNCPAEGKNLPRAGACVGMVAVADGDTITVEPARGGDRVKIRLHGIDAPERKQPYGETARGFVSNSVLFKQVDVQPRDRDRYGRTVAIVDVPGSFNPQDLDTT